MENMSIKMLLKKKLVYVNNNRLASYLDEKNQLREPTQCFLYNTFTMGSNGEKKTGATLFLSSVCNLLLSQ